MRNADLGVKVPMTPKNDDHWLVRPATIRVLWIGFIAILVLTVLADLVIQPKGKFGIDGTVGFYAWYGFLACVVLVVGARLLGLIFSRPDDYYGS